MTDKMTYETFETFEIAADVREGLVRALRATVEASLVQANLCRDTNPMATCSPTEQGLHDRRCIELQQAQRTLAEIQNLSFGVRIKDRWIRYSE